MNMTTLAETIETLCTVEMRARGPTVGAETGQVEICSNQRILPPQRVPDGSSWRYAGRHDTALGVESDSHHLASHSTISNLDLVPAALEFCPNFS
jgi:hypothetical protein